MNCNEVRELLPDLAAGIGAGTPEVEKHIASCPACAAKLQGFQQTMALLDEWQAPEPSPYFDTRLQARLREEMTRPAAGWVHWLRHPVWAMALSALLLAGAIAIGSKSYTASYIDKTEAINTRPPELSVPVLPGTAVGDLQALERNNELYADFDVLDDLQVQDDVTANP
jgi:predicted anti-sigma-YlaC factor YlaD